MDIEKTAVGVGKGAIDYEIHTAKGPGSAMDANVNQHKVGVVHSEMNYDERLFNFTHLTASQKMIFGEFGVLHRLNIISLQNDLARHRAAVWQGKSASKTETENLRKTLRDYAQAIRDYDYIRNLEPVGVNDAAAWRDTLEKSFEEIAHLGNKPYSTLYRRLQEPKPGSDTMQRILKWVVPKHQYYQKEKHERKGDLQSLIQGDALENTTHLVRVLTLYIPRFFITAICGASLIAPMIIMSLDKSLVKSLVTTSVAIVLVAAFLSAIPGPGYSDIIAATATYAAVLVVFVGLSS